MQAYDLIMLVVLGMTTIFGAIKGFAWQVASLASIIVSYVVAYRFRFDLASMIQATPPWNVFLAMLILYVATSFVIWVAFRLLSGAIDRVRLKEFDRHLGAGLGLAKGALFCLLITMFAMTLLGPKQQAAICQSRSGYYISTALDKAAGVLPKEIHDVVGPYLERLDSRLKGSTTGTGISWPGVPGLGGAENGSSSNWNIPGFWPPGAEPKTQPSSGESGVGGFQLPQNFPPLVMPPGSGSVSGGAVVPTIQQQAQQPGTVWPR